MIRVLDETLSVPLAAGRAASDRSPFPSPRHRRQYVTVTNYFGVQGYWIAAATGLAIAQRVSNCLVGALGGHRRHG